MSVSFMTKAAKWNERSWKWLSKLISINISFQVQNMPVENTFLVNISFKIPQACSQIKKNKSCSMYKYYYRTKTNPQI